VPKSFTCKDDGLCEYDASMYPFPRAEEEATTDPIYEAKTICQANQLTHILTLRVWRRMEIILKKWPA
jgi:hypothetical protein